MATSCRVWTIYQARCRLCEWGGELTGDSKAAAYDAKIHRASAEHKRNMTEERTRRGRTHGR